MVDACIYLEGGAKGPDSKLLTIICQKAFHKLLEQMGFTGKKPKLVACGGRGAVYERFCTAHTAGTCDYVAMWIDSEEPMHNIEEAWKHLATVDTVPAWKKPDRSKDDQVLFMTTCMETWIAADRKTLREHYGSELQESALPPLNRLEERNRHDVQEKLKHATRNCRNAYEKGKESYIILGKLDPTMLRQHLPSFVRVQRILDDKL
jgi:hypothetical protein